MQGAGLGRNASHFGFCEPHWKNGGKPLKRRPQRPRAQEPRVLAWGRIHIVPSAVGVVEAEARRRQLTRSGVVAELVEAWAQAQLGPPAPASCRVEGCGRVVFARGLCRPHSIQERRGQRLRPVLEHIPEQVQVGSLRLPAGLARRLRAAAKATGRTVPDLIRRALASGLEDSVALAARAPARGREGLRLGMLRLPAGTAQRLNLVAQELGIASSDVIRRAVEVSLSPGV
jgi:predicted DNA-binding protein